MDTRHLRHAGAHPGDGAEPVKPAEPVLVTASTSSERELLKVFQPAALEPSANANSNSDSNARPE